MKSLTRNWFLGIAGCLILVTGIALAGKGGKGGGNGGGPGGGDQTVVIHGCITFDDLTSDRVKSDGAGSYCDSAGSSIDLLEFFIFNVEFARDDRTLSLDFTEVLDSNGDPLALNDLPANVEFWTLAISGHHLDEWRNLSEGSSAEWDGKLRFGKRKDELVILYGAFDKGLPLTVTRTGEDVWEIEGDYAEVARQGKGNANFDVLGSGFMPFKVEYVGTQ